MEPPMPRETKIVATIGPASDALETMEAMIREGMNVARLNFSHGTPEDHQGRAARLRKAARRVGLEIAIMADLQGPKIRVGTFADGAVDLQPDQAFVLDTQRQTPGDIHGVRLDYADLPSMVGPGDVLLLNDGLIAIEVERVEGAAVHTRVLQGGKLSDRKGINKRGGGLTTPALTDKDKADLITAVNLGADYLAISFVKDAADMELARELAQQAAAASPKLVPPGLIAKIERTEAIPALPDILAASDGIMVARGDLAVEVGHAAVPALQKRMIELAKADDDLVITATQMMESMINSPMPTRAEVSDVANAVLEGTDAVMLSAESAVGDFPVQTIREMAAICKAAELASEDPLSIPFDDKGFEAIDQAIAMGALFTAHRLGAKAIVALTDSGSTPKWMSRHLLHIPIYALTTKVHVQRRMVLYRNVRPRLMPISADRDTALHQAETYLRSRNILDTGDIYAITCGDPMGTARGTNMVKICRVG